MNKRTLAALTAGIVLGSTGTAVAAGKLIYVKHAGVICAFGAGPQGRGAACLLSDKKGYGVTVTKTRVLVWKDSNSRIVFSRRQLRR